MTVETENLKIIIFKRVKSETHVAYMNSYIDLKKKNLIPIISEIKKQRLSSQKSTSAYYLTIKFECHAVSILELNIGILVLKNYWSVP